VSERYDTKPALLVLGYHGVSINSRDLYSLDLLAAILGDGESSRLNASIKEKGKLVYSIGAYDYTPREPGLFVVQSFLEEESLERAVSAIKAQIEIVKNEPPRQFEIDRARKLIKTKVLFGLATIDGNADDIGENTILTGEPNFTQAYLDGIDGVTAQDISIAAKAYLRDDNLTVAMILPKGEGSGHAKEPALPQRSKPIEEITLRNGMRILMREDHALPLVSIRASFCGGVRFEEERVQGISNLTSSTLLKGTRLKSAQDLAKLIDELGGEVSTESANNTFSIMMNLQSQDARRGLSLLRELLVDATFPEAELNRQKEIVIAQIGAQEKDIFIATEKLLRKTLYLKHPYKFSSLGSRESVRRLTRKEVSGFYKNACNPKNAVLAIFGDIDPKEIRRELTAFERVSAGRFSAPALSDEELPEALRERELRMEKEQAILMIGFLGTKVSAKDRYAFDVLTSILSHGGGRIYSQIREKLGLAYTLGSYNVLGLERGYYVFYVATTSDKIAITRENLLSVIKSVKENPPSAEEMANAKSALVSGHWLSLQTNAGLAKEAALDELFGLGYNNYQCYAQKINSVTGEDLERIASAYFDLNSAVVVTTLPIGNTD